jgi:hypothetical protein
MKKIICVKTRLQLRITGFVDFVHRPEFYATIKHSVSETGSLYIFRLGQEGTYSIRSLRKNCLQSLDMDMSYNNSHTNTWHQAQSMRSKKKICSKVSWRNMHRVELWYKWRWSSFRNFVFSSYLEFRTMGKVQKPGDSECCTPSSEPFRFY